MSAWLGNAKKTKVCSHRFWVSSGDRNGASEAGQRLQVSMLLGSEGTVGKMCISWIDIWVAAANNNELLA